ncbi:MAG: BT_3928 family protein [Bacteroidia bacterium]
MKLIANILRVITGVLFVFSGFIKINDPVGFAIKLEEYLLVFVSDLKSNSDFLANVCSFLIPYTLLLGIFICVVEVVLGLSLLIGWKKNLSLSLLGLMIIFFTFLTWYSAHYNKVTDCGCFGNAIPLTPWESFTKDVLLCVFILILVLLRKYIKPVFSHGFSWKLLLFFSVSGFAFSFYCWYYLPVFNFLKFAKGNNIEKLTTLPPNARQEKREMVFIYTRDGKDYEFTLEQLEERKIAENPAFKFKDRLDKVIDEGDKPEIHDFVMVDADGKNYVPQFFAKDEYKLLLVSQGLTSTRPKAMKKITALAIEWASSTKFDFWALTSSAPAEAEAIRHEYQFPFKFYYGDNTNLKSIIRSNPGLLLFKKGTVIAIWPSTDLPSYKQLLRKMK